MISTMAKPQLLLLALEQESFFNEMFADFLSTLRAAYKVTVVTSEAQAISLLASTSFISVLITDPGVAKKKFKRVRSELSKYVVQKGGTAIFCGHFCSMIDMPTLDVIFNDLFGLTWKHGEYFRSTFSFNRTTKLGDIPMPGAYSMKALNLSGVARNDAVYVATPNSRVESLVFGPTPVDCTNDEAPVTFTQVGQGYVGYVGDVNAEEATTDVVLSMCNFASAQRTPPGDPAVSPSGSTHEQALISTQRQGKPAVCCEPSCDRAKADGFSLKRCTGCHVARYCSRECQKKHWQEHKQVCKAPSGQSAGDTVSNE